MTTADNWLPIETAPKDGTVILVQHPDGVSRAVYLPRKDMWVSPDGADGFEPTRWMPLSDSSSLDQGEVS